jgi:hypothetical protein
VRDGKFFPYVAGAAAPLEYAAAAVKGINIPRRCDWKLDSE